MGVVQLCIEFQPYVAVSVLAHATQALRGEAPQYGAANASSCLQSSHALMQWLFIGKHQACDAVVQIGMAGFGAGLTWAGIVVQWQ